MKKVVEITKFKDKPEFEGKTLEVLVENKKSTKIISGGERKPKPPKPSLRDLVEQLVIDVKDLKVNIKEHNEIFQRNNLK
jgi:hypothetical protein